MLAHIRSGALVRTLSDKGWFQLEGGGWVSPPVEGYVNGTDKIVPLVEETVDNSTGPDTKRSTATTVEASRVLRTTTISDMTAQEVNDRKGALVLSEADTVIAKAMFKLMNDTHPNAPFTKQQFLNWMEAQL